MKETPAKQWIEIDEVKNAVKLGTICWKELKNLSLDTKNVWINEAIM